MQIAGTLFAAVSFSAANLAFKYIDPKDYSKESHRHNVQMRPTQRLTRPGVGKIS